MKISNWLRILSCPTYSASVAGRKLRSICSSWTEDGLAEIRRSVSTATLGFCQSLQGRTDALGHCEPRSEALDRGERLFVAVAEPDQRVQHVVARSTFCLRRHRVCQLALQFEQQALGGLLADARDPGEARGFLQRHGLRQLDRKSTRL